MENLVIESMIHWFYSFLKCRKDLNICNKYKMCQIVVFVWFVLFKTELHSTVRGNQMVKYDKMIFFTTEHQFFSCRQKYEKRWRYVGGWNLWYWCCYVGISEDVEAYIWFISRHLTCCVISVISSWHTHLLLHLLYSGLMTTIIGNYSWCHVINI